MDFSAKRLKEEREEKRKLLKEKSFSEKKALAQSTPNTKNLKDFIKLNKSSLYKTALNRGATSQLVTNSFTEKWWNNADYTNFLIARGFDIIDFDNAYFGTWFGEIHQLEIEDLVKLEHFLLFNFEKIKNLPKKVLNNSKLKRIIVSFSSNSVKSINVLRLFVTFQKLNDLKYGDEDEDGDEDGVFLSQLEDILTDVFNHLSSVLPNSINWNYVGMTARQECFLVSWRFPSEATQKDDGLTAENLNWLSSKQGNDAFLRFYEVIQAKSGSTKSYLEASISSDEDGRIVFLDKGLADISIHLAPKELKSLFESLDFAVELLGKGSIGTLKISWE
jgi:hypothetical protein